MEARTGDNVLISPEVTHKSEWTQGIVIDVEQNPFVGTVISAKTATGEIYFDKEYQFKPSEFRHDQRRESHQSLQCYQRTEGY